MRARYWLIGAVAVGSIIAGGVLLTVAASEGESVGALIVGKDSGVQACEAIRDAEAEAETTDEPWTADEYQQLRKLFADSRHEAIRTNGIELMDIGWQIEQMGEDAGFEALPLLGSFMDAYAGLAGGCVEQGVVIPPLEFEDTGS